MVHCETCESPVYRLEKRLTGAFDSDDIFQRLSPYLGRNAPVDVLDLWPATGQLSAKIHEYLRPRRHVLIEPNLERWGVFLHPLVAGKPGMEVQSWDPYTYEHWGSFLQEHFPEQRVPDIQNAVALPKNDTLLVLAQPMVSTNTQSHITPGRWWSAMMQDCMRQIGLHQYGSVRILATLTGNEAQAVLPRSTGDVTRISALTESVGLHTFEVAKPYEEEDWPALQMWSTLCAKQDRVAERTAAQQIVVPSGREAPRLKLAPARPNKDDFSPPRVYFKKHDQMMADMVAGESFDKKDTSEEAVQARKLARATAAKFHLENRRCEAREHLAQQHLDLDERMRALARAAANPRVTASELAQLNDEVVRLKNAIPHEFTKFHFRVYRSYQRLLDDARIASFSKNYDNSILAWDRRPFEPLAIHEGEQYPHVPRTLVYFEADENSPVMEKLRGLSFEKRQEAIEFFDSLSFVLRSKETKTVAELAEDIFPGRSANDLVQTIPSLARWAWKQLKPGSGPLPLPDETLDPTECYQANLEYDLSDTRLHGIPTTVLWDIVLEYQRVAMDLSQLQFSRLIGGTVTDYRAGGYQSKAKLR
ncbi:hypothetical protein N7492_006516 [Penicillium capsulatum]|uniref:rRNA adenine N(6)-methyltransferase n=1 Tax=Penicillium capsulatum TaxID=69766 RepID=A0A9W9HZG0_9EURO|nr:hypothetical protein N7492_006516 [Penicillium capsulatum]KAJ6116352.1 hypothetical protein N7512_006077 [Penicillium capsulatum]